MIPCAQWVPQLLLAALVVLGCGASDGPAPPETPPPDTTPAQYTLVWSDEFDGAGPPDSSRWGYDVGDGCPGLCGWGNNELQYYTGRLADNARLEDGHLVIEARREPAGSRAYSSARLVTKGRGDWKYGRFEIRARLPSGVGTWPAIWMLPTVAAYGVWPASGEIDIMEHVGFAPDSIHAAVHTAAYNHMQGTQRTSRIVVPDCEQAFHTYAIEWTPNRIDFFVDEARYHSFANEGSGSRTWPFDQPFHLILNIAVGGGWGGMQGVDDGIWPQRMTVDYVRVYQKR
jgi:beta-glucanase (GH16 family)